MRERGTVWPIVVVAVTAICVLVIVPLVVQRQDASHMATVDAYVSIGDPTGSKNSDPSVANYRWPNSEVPRTAERLRDVTGVSIAAAAYMIEGSLHGHAPRDADEVITGIVRRGLIPSEWQTDQPGVLRTTHATVHLRCSSPTLTLEVISVPNERLDGPAILIRVPDSENPAVGSRYFESIQLDGVVYPRPFVPIAEIIASGWQPRLFKQTQIADADRAQLERWAKDAKRDSHQ